MKQEKYAAGKLVMQYVAELCLKFNKIWGEKSQLKSETYILRTAQTHCVAAHVPASNILLSVQIQIGMCSHLRHRLVVPLRAQGSVVAVERLHSSQVHRCLQGF